MSTRARVFRVFLIVTLLVLAVPAFFFGRLLLFPPTFDVTSIAASPTYQDPALLVAAWQLRPPFADRRISGRPRSSLRSRRERPLPALAGFARSTVLGHRHRRFFEREKARLARASMKRP
jgi:hypothetical protein